MRKQERLLPLREAMAVVTERLLDHPVGRAQQLWRGWTEVVGPLLSRHTEPVRLSDGTLTIRVDSPAWKSELEFIKPELLERLAPLLPAGELKRIQLKQGSLRLAPGNAAVPVPVPLFQPPPPRPEEIARITQAVAEVADPDLRDLLYRLGIKLAVRNRDAGPLSS